MKPSLTPTHLEKGRSGSNPSGSKYPIFKDSGPKYHTLNGFWNHLEPLGMKMAARAKATIMLF